MVVTARVKFPLPGSWLKHYPCEGGRLPFYLQFLAELPYATASGAVCTMKLENGTVIQANPQLLGWLQPLEAGDRKPTVKITLPQPARPKAKVDGKLKGPAMAAAAEPEWVSSGVMENSGALWPRLTGRSA